ncbi:hypothetical protein WR25_04611 [Diploscapter pachys]|uniref:Uncharacterized protein n=1 Tax=Diploscapter pachys TaxID=2018661 RepID=A0A2A2LKQ9_9BILA|nr:hypothetical protein WR25_04611 [Diploscapter pachys]
MKENDKRVTNLAEKERKGGFLTNKHPASGTVIFRRTDDLKPKGKKVKTKLKKTETEHDSCSGAVQFRMKRRKRREEEGKATEKRARH